MYKTNYSRAGLFTVFSLSLSVANGFQDTPIENENEWTPIQFQDDVVSSSHSDWMMESLLDRLTYSKLVENDLGMLFLETKPRLIPTRSSLSADFSLEGRLQLDDNVAGELLHYNQNGVNLTGMGLDFSLVTIAYFHGEQTVIPGSVLHQLKPGRTPIVDFNGSHEGDIFKYQGIAVGGKIGGFDLDLGTTLGRSDPSQKGYWLRAGTGPVNLTVFEATAQHDYHSYGFTGETVTDIGSFNMFYARNKDSGFGSTNRYSTKLAGFGYASRPFGKRRLTIGLDVSRENRPFGEVDDRALLRFAFQSPSPVILTLDDSRPPEPEHTPEENAPRGSRIGVIAGGAVLAAAAAGGGGGGGGSSDAATLSRNVTVAGNIEAWQDTEIIVPAGRRLLITASRCIKHGPDSPCIGPDGNTNALTQDRFAPGRRQLGLVGRIGNTTFDVTSRFDSTTPTAGRLYLAFNDTVGTFGDNTGSFDVRVSVF